MWRALRRVATGLPLVAILPAMAAAQPEPEVSPRAEGRRYLDYYVSQYRSTDEAAGAGGAGAVGGRLMWSIGPLLRADRPWLGRTMLGGFVTRTEEDADQPETWRYGIQLDYVVTPAPLAGRVEPLLSLGAGAVRATEPGMRWSSLPYVLAPADGVVPASPAPLLVASLPDRTSTRASLVPGVGARIRILPGLSLRTDARQVIDFRDGMKGHLELSGGISVGT